MFANTNEPKNKNSQLGCYYYCDLRTKIMFAYLKIKKFEIEIEFWNIVANSSQNLLEYITYTIKQRWTSGICVCNLWL